MHGGSRSTIKSIGAPDQEGANPRRGIAPGESGRWDNRDARAIARPTLAIITTTAVARRNEIRDNSSDPPTDLSVHITTGSSGASMRYTTDGSIPHTGSVPNGTLISGTSGYVTIQANTVKTLKAIAFGAAYQDSTVTSAVFDRVDHTTTCVPPTFNPYGQSQGQHPPVAVPVTISTTTTGASISYTLSSSSNDIPTPTHGTIVNATSTTAWIGINNFWYLKAIAFKSGSYNSSVTSSTYDNTDPGGGNSPVQGDDKLSGHGSRGQRQLNQLDSVRSVNYTLDNCGNRTQVVDAGVTKTYTPNNLNQYTTGHGMAVTNGPSHEISTFNGTNYSYIADSYVVKASTVTGNNSYTLFYDALGRCVKRTSVTNGGTPVTNYYIFDGEHWVVEYDANGAIQSNALYGIGMDEVIARGTVNQGGWFYFPDRNGNISVVTDGVNTVRESYRYDAFGAPTVTVGPGQQPINNRFLFTGREWNATYGFYEYRARAYNPTLGRFTSEDPKGFDAGDYNLYRYCNNDPMDLSDPMGLLSGFYQYRLAYDPNERLDATHDGYHVEGVPGTEEKPGGIHLEVNRSVETMSHLPSAASGATTHAMTASAVNGTPTIHEQINVRYASDAGPKTQAFARNNEWTHSADLMREANNYRASAAAWATTNNLSSASALGLLQRGGLSGNVRFPSVSRFGHDAVGRSAMRWDNRLINIDMSWLAPNGTRVWPHTPIDPESGNPLNYNE